MLKVVGASWVQTTSSFFILLSILIFGIVLIFCVNYRSEDDGKYAATVFWNPYTEGFDIYLWGQNNDPKEISRGAARAYYQPNMQETGWAVLEIETNGDHSDKIQSFAAGMLEGSLSWQHIYWQWTNTIKEPCLTRKDYCNQIRSFLSNNTNVVKERAEERGKNDPFWHQVNLFYIQLDGIEFGWRYEMKRNRQEYEIPKIDFMWMNMISDFKDFEKLSGQTNNVTNPTPVAMTLLKLLSKNCSNFLLAHASSGPYNSMLRIQKKYQFNYHLTDRPDSKLVPGRTITFTSYPASVHSQDDFYQINLQENNVEKTKITVTGTALNLNSYKKDNMTNQVLLGPRVMAANRLSKNGKIWSNILKTYNDVVGNKQWMHVLTKSREMHLWVLEQTYQKTTAKNETRILQKQGYWIHCGIPHYQELAKESDSVKSNLNYTILPSDTIAVDTEKVLKSGQHNVTNLSSLINLIRGPDLSLVGRTDLHITNIYEFVPPNLETYSSNATEEKLKTNSSKFIYYNKNSDSYKIRIDDTWLQVLHLKKILSVMQPLRTRFETSVVGKKHGKSHRNVSTSIENKTFYPINGIIDLKVTENNKNFFAAAGPPFNVDDKSHLIEPFQWSKSKINFLPHYGHSDVWNYQPVVANFVWS